MYGKEKIVEKSKKKLYPVKTNVVRVNCDCGFYKYFYI